MATTLTTIKSLTIGAITGAAAGLLLVPQKGSSSRKKIKEKLKNTVASLQDEAELAELKAKDAADKVNGNVAELTNNAKENASKLKSKLVGAKSKISNTKNNAKNKLNDAEVKISQEIDKTQRQLNQV